MAFCTDCGHQFQDQARFCAGCGNPRGNAQAMAREVSTPHAPALSERPPSTHTFSPNAPPAAASKGFIQTFGLDVRVALLAVIVDLIVFAGTVSSMGLLIPVEFGAAAMLGVITYKIQRAWYGDGHDSALIKALIIALITAIPVPITGLIAVPGGLLGFFNLFRLKK